MRDPNRDLGTTEISRAVHVAARTVTKWIDAGLLRAYRLPNTRRRRVSVRDLLAFCRAHEMPCDLPPELLPDDADPCNATRDASHAA